MLKTRDQQNQEKIGVNPDRLVLNSDLQPTVTTVEDLETASLENVQALIDDFKNETKQRNQISRKLNRMMTGGNLLLFGLVLFSLRDLHHVNWWYTGAALALQALLPLVSIVPIMALTRPSKKQRAIIDRLIAGKDVRAIGPILDGLMSKNKPTRLVAIKALTALLPNVNESNTELVPYSSRLGLASVVKYANSPLGRRIFGNLPDDFLVAVLQSLKLVGEKSALEPVEALASGSPSTAGAKRIQLAAIACLEPLRLRVERDSVGQHLLRSSAQPESGVNTLLIPTSETTADANELPRSSAKG